MARLNIIKTHANFSTCRKCNFTYMAMNKLAESYCPKCNPEIFESDSDYLNNAGSTGFPSTAVRLPVI